MWFQFVQRILVLDFGRFEFYAWRFVGLSVVATALEFSMVLSKKGIKLFFRIYYLKKQQAT